ncbi:related to acyl-CoA transferases/carnitine dehydratase [Rhynchosporium agropyri]|uniref:Related to acyl-CoA transferases/carnitine dehydratase n=1 Tax=Rhynchosporium agropyri TaxID=914238 RepID=A0A1E1LGQ9_9HELO|nr:related to acyl-CoA transferases/carnitine dehydratase [Rhynchosporium agropyri]
MRSRCLSSIHRIARGKWILGCQAARSTNISLAQRITFSTSSTDRSEESKKDQQQRHKHFIYENRSQQNARQPESKNSPSTSSVSQPRPLDGVTVIALEQVIAGPYCTRQLAEMGARVVKIERPGQGDFARGYDTRAGGLSSHFAWTNRSKQSLALDIKNPEDLALLKKLITKADVFLQNLAPGAADRLGLGYEALKETNERLIVCDISGYGADGPYKDKKAYDLLIQAEAGMLSITGTEETPSKVGASIADIAAGMYAFSSIMAALLVRAKTGKGCRIDVSMLECMVEWMGYPLYYSYDGASPPPRAGASHATIYPYGPFQARDATIMLGLQNEREWTSFCTKVLQNSSLISDPRFSSADLRSENRTQLKQIIESVFSRMTAEEVVQRLDEAAIGNAKVNDMHAVWEHLQLRERKRWKEIKTEKGTLKVSIPPAIPSNVEPIIGPVPRVGAHNEKIMRELEEGSFGKKHYQNPRI